MITGTCTTGLVGRGSTTGTVEHAANIAASNMVLMRTPKSSDDCPQPAVSAGALLPDCSGIPAIFDMKPMRVIKFILVFVVGTAVSVILAGQSGMLAGTPPDDLGVRNGRLKPPSFSPNSVSSQANLHPDHPLQTYAMIEAFPTGKNGIKSLDKIEAILRQSGTTQIVKREPDYIYAQSTTPLLRFTDDLEFWLDAEQGVIHVRSASRIGEDDLGTNRKRAETIRAEFMKN